MTGKGLGTGAKILNSCCLVSAFERVCSVACGFPQGIRELVNDGEAKAPDIYCVIAET